MSFGVVCFSPMSLGLRPHCLGSWPLARKSALAATTNPETTNDQSHQLQTHFSVASAPSAPPVRCRSRRHRHRLRRTGRRLGVRPRSVLDLRRSSLASRRRAGQAGPRRQGGVRPVRHPCRSLGVRRGAEGSRDSYRQRDGGQSPTDDVGVAGHRRRPPDGAAHRPHAARRRVPQRDVGARRRIRLLWPDVLRLERGWIPADPPERRPDL